MKYKQVIVIRNDLNLSKGKLAVQAAHASLSVYSRTGKILKDKWEREGSKKVVLSVNSEAELKEIYNKAKRRGLPCVLIRDAGLTEVPAGTATAVGIGPEKEELIDKVTGSVALLD